MKRINEIIKIVVTGPESTGKTTLSQSLAEKLGCEWIPEYARSYIESLNRPYTFEDVEKIAHEQILQEHQYSERVGSGFLILDTWLIITKVWFDIVYGRFPEWIDQKIRVGNINLFLVCEPDLPWIQDSVRENGGEMRNILFERYCTEIEKYGFQYEIIGGIGEDRVRNAVEVLKLRCLL